MKPIAVFFAAIPFLLCSCEKSQANAAASSDIFAMDTYMNIKAYGNNASDALDTAEAEIYRLEQLFSVTDENSEVYKLNSSCGKSVPVSDDLKNLIDFSIDIGRETDGALDITIYPLLREWGFTADEYKIPSQEQIDLLLKNVDYSSIISEGNNITVPCGAQVDFGAVTKGYTSDRIVDIFRENEITSAVINLGGNVHAIGKKPDGSMWNVAVTNPLFPDETLGILKVSDKAVITSGSYERYFIGNDGKKYSHIIDTSTGYPVENGIVSVTVTGESGVLCDALSTALFVMGREKAEEYLKKRSDIAAILVEDNGNIIISEEIADSFKNLSGFPVEVLYNES